MQENQYRQIQPCEVQGNPFEMLGKRWALVTAGDENGINTMTVSWGMLGVMWGQDVVQVVIRPQRYTKEFVDRTGRFTLSFYGPDAKPTLGYFGKVSGRDEDKIAKAGWKPRLFGKAPAFEGAELVFSCRILHSQRLNPEGFAPDANCDERWYPEKDYHEMYIATIEQVFVKE